MEFKAGVCALPAGEVSYFVGGRGRDLVYLHPAAGMRFTAPVERLARSFRVWAPIVPGFDGTEPIEGVRTMPAVAELITAFMDATIGKRCDVVGQSLGAWLGAWLAILHPENVGQLVLGAPAGFLPEGAPPPSFDPDVFAAQLYAHPERRPPEDKPAEIVARNREMVARYGCASGRDPALIARAGEIGCLTLILHGTKDVRVPRAAVQRLRHDIARSQLVYIYDAAHGIETDQPDKVGALIEDFLMRAEVFIVNPGRPQDGPATAH